MKQDIHIRKATESDLDYIEKLYEDICGYLETHKNYPGWKKGIYPNRCDAKNGLMADDFLKCGVGTELLTFAECVARKEQCISIRLDVVKDNIPAERLYQKCGYQFIGTVSLGYEAYGLPWYDLYEKVL